MKKYFFVSDKWVNQYFAGWTINANKQTWMRTTATYHHELSQRGWFFAKFVTIPNYHQFERVPNTSYELLNPIKDFCLVSYYTLIADSEFSSFTASLFVTTFTTMKEGTKYRKEDRYTCIVAVQFHNKSYYNVTNRATMDNGNKKKTGTSTMWPTNSSQTFKTTLRTK